MSILIALLGLGFGVLQLLNRPDPTSALLAAAPPDLSATSLTAASVGPPVQLAAVAGPSTSGEPLSQASRTVAMSVKILEPNYTVAAGDTLSKIATRFNTTVDRIQALNGLTDPRALRIGARLVIPPPL